MGPTPGQTEVRIELENLYESKYLSARFISTVTNTVLQAPVRVSGPAEIVVEAPEWIDAAPESCFIEVAMNGQDYSRLPEKYAYYEPPEADSMKPSCTPHTVPCTVSIYGHEFFDPPQQDQIIVRFASEKNEVELPGKFRILGVQQEVVVEVPPFGVADILSVAVSFNAGEDYSPVPGELIVYEPLGAVKTLPTCGPVAGGSSIQVEAFGLFPAEKPFVRFVATTQPPLLDGAEEGTEPPEPIVKELYAEAQYVESGRNGKPCIEFMTPIWREPPLSEEPEEAAEEAAAVPDSVSCAIAIGLNGKNFQPIATPFTFYEAPSNPNPSPNPNPPFTFYEAPSAF